MNFFVGRSASGVGCRRSRSDRGSMLNPLSPWFPLLVLFGLIWCSLVLFGPKFIFAKPCPKPSLNFLFFPNLPVIYAFIYLTPVISSLTLFLMITWIIKDGFEAACIRAIRGRPLVPFASFCSPIRVDQCPSVVASSAFHTTAQKRVVFAPMCTSVHLRAPLCAKTEKSKMVHKPHRTAHRESLAPTCIKLHQVAGKKFARGTATRSLTSTPGRRG